MTHPSTIATLERYLDWQDADVMVTCEPVPNLVAAAEDNGLRSELRHLAEAGLLVLIYDDRRGATALAPEDRTACAAWLARTHPDGIPQGATEAYIAEGLGRAPKG